MRNITSCIHSRSSSLRPYGNYRQVLPAYILPFPHTRFTRMYIFTYLPRENPTCLRRHRRRRLGLDNSLLRRRDFLRGLICTDSCLVGHGAGAAATPPGKPQSPCQSPSSIDDRVHCSNEQADEEPYLGDDGPGFEELQMKQSVSIYKGLLACWLAHRLREDVIPVQRQRPHNPCDEADDGAEDARDHGRAVHPLERLWWIRALHAVQVLGLENGDPVGLLALAVVFGRIFFLDGVEEEEDAPVEVLGLDRILSALAGNMNVSSLLSLSCTSP